MRLEIKAFSRSDSSHRRWCEERTAVCRCLFDFLFDFGHRLLPRTDAYFSALKRLIDAETSRLGNRTVGSEEKAFSAVRRI